MIPKDKYKVVLTNRSQTIRATILSSNNGCIGEFTIDVAVKKKPHPIQWVEAYLGYDTVINRILTIYERQLMYFAHELRYGTIGIPTDEEDTCPVISYKKATETEFEELVVLVEV